MKKRYLFLILSLLSFSMVLRAQEAGEGEQLLVFRNTGVVDLLYTNEVDSILTNESTQVFYAKDTVLVVPLAELDSVAVGNRNEMVFYKDVKELSKSEDLPWIIRFDGESIFYRNDTPSNILPSVGMKLFYGLEEQISEENIFPFGLSVKVTNVTKQTGETRVDVEVVGLDEIFERLFLAGSFRGTTSSSRLMNTRVPVNRTLNLESTLELGDFGSFSVSGNLNVDGEIVYNINNLNPFNRHKHYHADLDLTCVFGSNVKLTSDDSAEYNDEKLGSDVSLGTFYKILNLNAAVGAFVDLSAELNLGVEMQRTYRRKLHWERNGDDNKFEFNKLDGSEPYKDEAKVDLTLDGEIYFGPIAQIDFVTVGDLLGAKAKLKFGPKIEGEISLGMIRQMDKYQPEFYGNASLNVCSQIALEGFVYNRQYLVWGKEEEHPIFKLTVPLAEHEWKLFPDYTQSNAMAKTTKSEEVVTDVATAVKSPTPTSLETGFVLADSLGNVVDSIFVGKIASEKEMEDIEKVENVQTFSTFFELPPSIKQKDMDGYTMRPVFHYAGYTISAAPVDIKNDVLIQPYTAKMCNGAMTFISSGPFLGSAEKDSTLYQVGAYLPVPLKKNVYKKNGFTIIKMGKHIDSGGANYMVGTWQGMIGEKEVTLILKSDFTGSYDTSRTFKYELNTPQSGDLQLTFDNGETSLFRVLSITENELKIEDKRQKDSEVIVLEKVSQE